MAAKSGPRALATRRHEVEEEEEGEEKGEEEENRAKKRVRRRTVSSARNSRTHTAAAAGPDARMSREKDSAWKKWPGCRDGQVWMSLAPPALSGRKRYDAGGLKPGSRLVILAGGFYRI